MRHTHRFPTTDLSWGRGGRGKEGQEVGDKGARVAGLTRSHLGCLEASPGLSQEAWVGASVHLVWRTVLESPGEGMSG